MHRQVQVLRTLHCLTRLLLAAAFNRLPGEPVMWAAAIILQLDLGQATASTHRLHKTGSCRCTRTRPIDFFAVRAPTPGTGASSLQTPWLTEAAAPRPRAFRVLAKSA